MSVFVNFLTGKTVVYICKNDDTIMDLKKIIFEDQKIPIDLQKIIFNGRILQDDEIVIVLSCMTTIFFCVVNKGG